MTIESKTTRLTEDERSQELFAGIAYAGGISKQGGSTLARVLAAMERRITQLEERLAIYEATGNLGRGDPPRRLPSVTAHGFSQGERDA